jgi:HK97 family phage major capsid protein
MSIKKTGLAAALAGVFANSERTIEELQNKLLSLHETANGIQAKADAENRPLTTEEQNDIDGCFAAFEDTTAEIERRKHLTSLAARLNQPGAPRTSTVTEEPAAAAPARVGVPTPRTVTQNRTPRVEALEDRNKWGFKSMGEFATAVRNASGRGGSVDPRLVANAPTTYSQEGVGADGGFAIPPDFRTEIVKKVMGEDSLLSRTDQQTSSSNSFTVPIDETTPWQTSGGIQAYWESEAGQKSQSKVSLTEMTVKLNKLVALVPVTDELLEDSNAIANYLRTKAPEKMTFKLNDALVSGTGAGQPLGYLRSPATVEVAPESGQAADTVRFQNIIDMWSRMYAPCRRNAVWMINQDVEQQLMTMSFRDNASDPSPVYMPPGGLADAPYGRLMGRPVVVSEAVPTLGDRGDISLVDMSTYLSIVKSGGIRQDVSIHLWFDYDVTAFRFVMRVGGQPWWRNTISRFQGSNTLSCFVTLGERA